MRLLLRTPFSASDDRPVLAPLPLTLFVIFASGFVISELCSEWEMAQNIFLAFPAWLTQLSGAEAFEGFIEGIWALFVAPMILWSLLWLVWRAGERVTPILLWRQIALPMAFIVASGHMAKGLAKFTSWAGFLPHALRDPAGLNTASAITQKTATAPEAFLPLPWAGAVGLVLVLAALALAVREYRLTCGELRPQHTIPFIIVAGLFSAILMGWILKVG